MPRRTYSKSKAIDLKKRPMKNKKKEKDTYSPVVSEETPTVDGLYYRAKTDVKSPDVKNLPESVPPQEVEEQLKKDIEDLEKRFNDLERRYQEELEKDKPEDERELVAVKVICSLVVYAIDSSSWSQKIITNIGEDLYDKFRKIAG